ncbi:MAG: sensor histidine kinase [Anaerolineae bacterium]
MDSVVHECKNLTQEDIAFLETIEVHLGLLADLSRADVLMYGPIGPHRAVVISQARPHSILPIFNRCLIGRQVTFREEPAVIRALEQGRRSLIEVCRGDDDRDSPVKRAPVIQETYPIQAHDGRVVAAVCIETNLIERERHRRRRKVFQRTLKQLQKAVLAGALQSAGPMSPFSEHDGVMVVDAQLRIQYMSSVATNLYRKLGYVGNLLKWHIQDLELDDNRVVLEAIERRQCIEREVQVHNLIWIKKAIPLFSLGPDASRVLRPGKTAPRLESVVVTIHDETEARRQQEELQVKAAMIQEIHHRVKNNLQTIASLLRLQARRAANEAVRRALHESTNRVLSVAVIHEFLAHQDARVINIRDISRRIINQMREGVLDGEERIRIELHGPNLYLPTQPATACALVINELLQNALEHGYQRQEGGTVTVLLQDGGDQITIAVDDDGVGLPEEFDLTQAHSLGLQIVRTLVQSDLKGCFELHRRDKGVSAVVTFPKYNQGGH